MVGSQVQLDVGDELAGYRGPAGITYRQLDSWTRTDLVARSRRDEVGGQRPAHGATNARCYLAHDRPAQADRPDGCVWAAGRSGQVVNVAMTAAWSVGAGWSRVGSSVMDGSAVAGTISTVGRLPGCTKVWDARMWSMSSGRPR